MVSSRKKFFAIIAIFSFLAAMGIGWLIKSRKTNPTSKPLQSQVGDFALLDHQGVMHHLYRYSNAKAIVVVSHANDCAPLQQAARDLERLKNEYEKKGIVFLMLNTSTHDDRLNILEEARKLDQTFPILLDPSQVVTRSLGISSVPENIIIDPVEWQIIARANLGDLAHTLNETLQKKPAPHMPKNSQANCPIIFRQHQSISYEKHIFPILKQKCMNCHSSGRRFPPFFENHNKVAAWSAMIRETLLTNRMPPFSADELYGKYANDLSLSPEEKSLLITWLDSGAPRDLTVPDPLLNLKLDKPKTKILRTKPIYSAHMEEAAKIKPGGEVEYKFFQLGGPVPYDLWVHATNTKSTNPRQLHHQSLMITPKPLEFYVRMAKRRRREDYVKQHSDGDVPIWVLHAIQRREEGIDPHYLRIQNWGLGKMQPLVLNKGSTVFIPKDYYIILESHYMGTGRPDAEKTTVEFYGALKSDGRRKLQTLSLVTTQIDIAPGASRYAVKTNPAYFKDSFEIVGFLGHLHMRGRAIRAEILTPDGKTRTIVSIPDYYYGWQTGTGLIPDPPIKIPAGSTITAICEYDNSAQNPYNPDPQKRVRYGQRHDTTEMCKMNLVLLKSK